MASNEREQVLAMAKAAKQVAPTLAGLNGNAKAEILRDAARTLLERCEEIVAANALDIAAGREAGLTEALIDRLALDAGRVEGIASGLSQVAALPDPVGELVEGRTLPNGLRATRVRVPLGVVGMVYEARPNVTVDAFGLTLKSGNAVLLRGSKTAKESNTKLVEILGDVLTAHDLPREAVQLLPCETHDSVQDLITARGLVDVVIPRGGAGLIQAVVLNATVPTIETGVGNCHVYVDATADVEMAKAIVINGKTRRPSVCNATETLLLDEALPAEARKEIVASLADAGVRIHGDATELQWPDAVAATEADWTDEYLSMDIAAKVVAGVEEAISHIGTYGTGHTEAIVAGDLATIQRFTDAVDAAAVMVNASTAFTDGEQYGMGAEIGVSTQKLHARGPFALTELTSTKWIITGEGQVRS